jgi:crotonobetainyl-CoA:carnitine CoA-transferase CaiB-like acyl-CoA transferase
VNQTSAYLAGGVVPTRAGNAHPSIFPYQPLPTADGDLVVIAGNDTQFVRLCEVLEAPELASDPRFARNRDRTRNRAELEPLLVARLSRRTADDWFAAFTAAGVPCAPINTVAEGVAYAEGLGLDPVVAPGGVRSARNPIRLSATPPSHRLPPPPLDGDGDELRDWLRSG